MRRDETARALFVTRKWPPAVGGMETYCVELTKALGVRLPVEVVALPGRANGDPPGIAALAGFAFRAAARCLRPQAEVVHIADMASWPLAWLAALGRSSPAIVLSAHGTDVAFHRRNTVKGRLYGAYLRLGARLLRDYRLIANSSATAAVAAETGWRNARVVALATDIDQPAPTAKHDGSLLFAGRLVERKGCLWFVENVLPLLPDSVRLKVAGPVWDEAERAALDHPRVDYLGSLSREELCAAYRQALCVIVPNIDPPSGEFEGFGLVAPEAAAAGGLVVAAATGGLSEAVIDGETGFLVPPADAAAWVSKITEIATWPSAERLGFLTRSWNRARAVFRWSRVADDVIAVYRTAPKEKFKPAAGQTPAAT